MRTQAPADVKMQMGPRDELERNVNVDVPPNKGNDALDGFPQIPKMVNLRVNEELYPPA